MVPDIILNLWAYMKASVVQCLVLDKVSGCLSADPHKAAKPWDENALSQGCYEGNMEGGNTRVCHPELLGIKAGNT